MKKSNLNIIIGLLIISNLIFVYLYTSEINLFKKDEYIYVNKADTLEFGDVLKYRFENLKLFKHYKDYKFESKFLINNDTSIIRTLLRKNPSADSVAILEHYLEHGEFYDSPYITANYKNLPDTIYANGYRINHVNLFGILDCEGGLNIKIMSYKYKK